MKCPKCFGAGDIVQDEIRGYVTHEMAMDAGDMRYENEPIYDQVAYICDLCEGTGKITKKKLDSYLVVSKIGNGSVSNDDEIPF